jgi:hypothetical protein
MRRIVRHTVSFSETVNGWAEKMALKRGQEHNFSAFLADLIREAIERENTLKQYIEPASSHF